MKVTRRVAAEARVAEACRTAATPVQLQQQVQQALARAMPIDRWCGVVFDPATVLPTGGYHDEGLPHAVMPALLALEHDDGDVNQFRDLARARTPGSTIGRASTVLEHSARYREVLRPAGLPNELRLVLRAGGRAWGAFVLLRGADAPDFTDEELALAVSLAPAVAVALRRLLAANDPRGPGADGPGLLMVSGHPLAIDAMTDAGRRWLAQIDDGSPEGQLPYCLMALAASARASGRTGVRGEHQLRTRTRSGQWLTCYAESLGSGPEAPVSLILEPSRPHEVAAIVAAAYGLSAREAETATLVARGLSTEEIAAAMFISPHTVRDHVKHAFEKTGSTSRAELVATLFFDQYLPRSESGVPVGADGWFIA